VRGAVSGSLTAFDAVDGSSTRQESARELLRLPRSVVALRRVFAMIEEDLRARMTMPVQRGKSVATGADCTRGPFFYVVRGALLKNEFVGLVVLGPRFELVQERLPQQ